MDAKLETLTREFIPDNAPGNGAWRLQTFAYILSDIIGSSSGTLLDLGAGHCLFSMKARDSGFKVTAVDARAVRVPPEADMAGIQFVKSDIRDFSPAGFDIICVLGLLYHLELPDQIDLLGKCAYTPTIVDTQIAEYDGITCEHEWQKATVSKDGYDGVLYPENDNPMAGWKNKTSFMHTEESLLKLFANCGFTKVTRLAPRYFSKYGPRTFYIAAP